MTARTARLLPADDTGSRLLDLRSLEALVRHYGEGKSYSDEPMDSGCEILIIDDLAADSDQYFIDILNTPN